MRELIRHILKEETEEFELDKNILNFLTRRYKVQNSDLGYEGNPLIFKTIYFNIDGETYAINDLQNKQTQVQEIFNMLINYNVIEPIEQYGKTFDLRRQIIVGTIKKFISSVM